MMFPSSVSFPVGKDIKYKYAIFLAGKLVGLEKVEPYRIVRCREETQVMSLQTRL